jgi:general secretion pathway protein G
LAETAASSRQVQPASAARRRNRRHSQAGFTLLELVIVMAIIALMAAVISPMLFNRLKEARVSTTRQQISLLDDALGSYRLDVGKYPTSEQGLQALIEKPEGVERWAGPYTGKRKLPQDGWEHDFVYRYPPDPADEASRKEGRDFDLFSLGADGKPGGEGEDADVY